MGARVGGGWGQGPCVVAASSLQSELPSRAGAWRIAQQWTKGGVLLSRYETNGDYTSKLIQQCDVF